MFFLEIFGAKKLGSDSFITDPGGYRKVEEKPRKNSDKFAGCNSAMVKSNDPATKCLTGIKV